MASSMFIIQNTPIVKNIGQREETAAPSCAFTGYIPLRILDGKLPLVMHPDQRWTRSTAVIRRTLGHGTCFRSEWPCQSPPSTRAYVIAPIATGWSSLACFPRREVSRDLRMYCFYTTTRTIVSNMAD